MALESVGRHSFDASAINVETRQQPRPQRGSLEGMRPSPGGSAAVPKHTRDRLQQARNLLPPPATAPRDDLPILPALSSDVDELTSRIPGAFPMEDIDTARAAMRAAQQQLINRLGTPAFSAARARLLELQEQHAPALDIERQKLELEQIVLRENPTITSSDEVWNLLTPPGPKHVDPPLASSRAILGALDALRAVQANPDATAAEKAKASVALEGTLIQQFPHLPSRHHMYAHLNGMLANGDAVRPHFHGTDFAALSGIEVPAIRTTGTPEEIEQSRKAHSAALRKRDCHAAAYELSAYATMFKEQIDAADAAGDTALRDTMMHAYARFQKDTEAQENHLRFAVDASANDVEIAKDLLAKAKAVLPRPLTQADHNQIEALQTELARTEATHAEHKEMLNIVKTKATDRILHDTHMDKYKSWSGIGISLAAATAAASVQSILSAIHFGAAKGFTDWGTGMLMDMALPQGASYLAKVFAHALRSIPSGIALGNVHLFDNNVLKPLLQYCVEGIARCNLAITGVPAAEAYPLDHEVVTRNGEVHKLAADALTNLNGPGGETAQKRTQFDQWKQGHKLGSQSGEWEFYLPFGLSHVAIRIVPHLYLLEKGMEVAADAMITNPLWRVLVSGVGGFGAGFISTLSQSLQRVDGMPTHTVAHKAAWAAALDAHASQAKTANDVATPDAMRTHINGYLEQRREMAEFADVLAHRQDEDAGAYVPRTKSSKATAAAKKGLKETWNLKDPAARQELLSRQFGAGFASFLTFMHGDGSAMLLDKIANKNIAYPLFTIASMLESADVLFTFFANNNAQGQTEKGIKAGEFSDPSTARVANSLATIKNPERKALAHAHPTDSKARKALQTSENQGHHRLQALMQFIPQSGVVLGNAILGAMLDP